MIYTLHRTPDGCTWTCRGCGVTSPVLRDDRAGDRWQRQHTSVHQGQRAVRGVQGPRKREQGAEASTDKEATTTAPQGRVNERSTT